MLQYALIIKSGQQISNWIHDDAVERMFGVSGSLKGVRLLASFR